MKPAQPAAYKDPKGLPAGGPKPPNSPPWRAVGVGVASLGTPAGIAILHPMLGEIIAVIEVMMVLTIIGTALFGSPALSERAFRLLRWIGNRPEPPSPASGLPACSSQADVQDAPG
jgi:hypothetical protein